jgi:hypothetical protein
LRERREWLRPDDRFQCSRHRIDGHPDDVGRDYYGGPVDVGTGDIRVDYRRPPTIVAERLRCRGDQPGQREIRWTMPKTDASRCQRCDHRRRTRFARLATATTPSPSLNPTSGAVVWRTNPDLHILEMSRPPGVPGLVANGIIVVSSFRWSVSTTRP